MVSVKKLAGALAVPFTMTACGSLGPVGLPRQSVTVDRYVQEVPVVLSACERENIKLRPAYEVTRGELMRRTQAGEEFYQYKGYYLFAEKGAVEKWAPLALTVAFGALGYKAGGSAPVTRVMTTTAGAFGGAIAGGVLSESAKLARLSHEAGCEQWIDSQVGAGVRVPVPNRGLDEGWGGSRPYYRGQAYPAYGWPR